MFRLPALRLFDRAKLLLNEREMEEEKNHNIKSSSGWDADMFLRFVCMCVYKPACQDASKCRGKKEHPLPFYTQRVLRGRQCFHWVDGT